MQQPTLQNVRIRSTRDACQIFYAVARTVLPMTTRRLDAEERRAIISGNVYVWEERCANSEATGMGMERWTDGMGWGPSRVRDEFLFYHQRETEVNEDPSHPSARWANMMRRRESRPGSTPFSRSESERLIKQTYSVHVSLPEDRPRGVTRKWHLTAYFSQNTLDSLGTIDEYPGVGDVVVPDGWFKSARASKAKRSENNSGDEMPSAADWGLGMPPSAHGLAQFALDAGAPPARYPPYMPPLSHAGPSAYVYAPRTPPAARAPPAPVQTPFAARIPTLHDAGLHAYRDPSPVLSFSSSTASSASEPDPAPPSPQPRPAPARAALQLVPLDVLEGTARPARDPVDEQLLRRFVASGAGVPRALAAGCDRLAAEELRPRIPVRVGTEAW